MDDKLKQSSETEVRIENYCAKDTGTAKDTRKWIFWRTLTQKMFLSRNTMLFCESEYFIDVAFRLREKKSCASESLHAGFFFEITEESG